MTAGQAYIGVDVGAATEVDDDTLLLLLLPLELLIWLELLATDDEELAELKALLLDVALDEELPGPALAPDDVDAELVEAMLLALLMLDNELVVALDIDIPELVEELAVEDKTDDELVEACPLPEVEDDIVNIGIDMLAELLDDAGPNDADGELVVETDEDIMLADAMLDVVLDTAAVVLLEGGLQVPNIGSQLPAPQ